MYWSTWPSCAPNFCSSSALKLRRAKCATYFTSRSVAAILLLVEVSLDQSFQLDHRARRIFSFSQKQQFAAWPCGEHHQAHDALAIDALAILLDVNLALEFA